MTRKQLVEDDASQYDSINQRLRRLEQSIPEDPHYVGASGQPGFLNGWTNLGGGWQTLRYWKGTSGVVYVQGAVTGGALGPVGTGDVFLLPVGYRPGGRLLLPTNSNSAYGVIHVYPAGQVVARIGTNADFSLFFSFRQEV
jgi:hypothetical protein